MRYVLENVRRFNLACDVPSATGKVKRRADGKILKLDGWVEPDIAGVLQDGVSQ